MPNSDQGDVLRDVDATCSKHPEETGRLVRGQLVGLCEDTARRVERELAAQGHDVRMGLTFELDQLLQEILESTHESTPSDEEVEVVLTGFLSRARALLSAMLTLARADQGFALQPLARSLMDLGLTARWLMTDPEENLSKLYGAYRFDWMKLQEKWTETTERDLYPEDDAFRALVDRENEVPPPAKRLPDPPSLADAAQMTHWYVTYRTSSMRTHATLLSGADVAISVDGSMKVTGLMPEPRLDREFLSLGGHMTMVVALVLDEHLGRARHAELEDLDWGLQELYTGLSREEIRERQAKMPPLDVNKESGKL